MLSPARRRQCVDHLQAELGISERRACAVAGQHRSTQRKRPRGRDDEEALTAAIIRLASQYGRYGYRRITALLRTEGWHVNAKRVQRIWRREGLKVPQKQPKRGRLWLNDGSCIRLRPCWPNHVWSYDFVMDRTHDGRKFRMLTVIDEFTRRCMAVVVERRLNSDNVLHCLTELFANMARRIISVPTTAQSLPLMPSATGSAGSASRPSISSPGHLGRTDTTRASTQSSGTKS